MDRARLADFGIVGESIPMWTLDEPRYYTVHKQQARHGIGMEVPGDSEYTTWLAQRVRNARQMHGSAHLI